MQINVRQTQSKVSHVPNNSAKQMGRNLKAAGRVCEGSTYISCACALGRLQWVFNGKLRSLAPTENQQ